jgi:hypothetical protein
MKYASSLGGCPNRGRPGKLGRRGWWGGDAWVACPHYKAWEPQRKRQETTLFDL